MYVAVCQGCDNNPKNDRKENKYLLSQLVKNPFPPPVFTIYTFDKF